MSNFDLQLAWEHDYLTSHDFDAYVKEREGQLLERAEMRASDDGMPLATLMINF